MVPSNLSGIALVTLVFAAPAFAGPEDFRFAPTAAAADLASGASHRALNAPQRLSVALGERGFRVVPEGAAEPWSLELGLAAWGRGNELASPSSPFLAVAETRAAWQRPGLEEWLENGARGVEHGFTLAERPPGPGPLRLELELRTALEPHVAAGARAVAFVPPGERLAVLHYSGLAAEDAEGRAVPARFELDGAGAEGVRRLRLIVEDEDAAYPVRIDPLVTSAAWNSPADHTLSVAWGDWDGDGDLDLAVGNFIDDPCRVYENSGGALELVPAWSALEVRQVWGVAWGDVDGDGNLDLAAAAYNEPNVVWKNLGGDLSLYPVWISSESDMTRSLAWGDVDGDGDLDLAVGNAGQPNRIYLNQGGALETTASWSSSESDLTLSVAWGDVDGDGDLDLAAGNVGKSRVYLNQSGTLETTASWSSDETASATSVAWGDVDGDGRLDLAVGDDENPNRVYLNQGTALETTASWGAALSGPTNSVAWGDVDGDGDLDLAVGLWDEALRVHVNTGSALETSPSWNSTEWDRAYSVAWGDWDNDGDLDLASGSDLEPNRVHENVGGLLATASVWNAPLAEETEQLAWGDWDGDGDLDLAVGNIGSQANRVYENDAGTLTSAWTSDETYNTSAIAWGDWDGDGDLDLAAGDSNAPVRIYGNTGGALASVETAPVTEPTNAVAWGDRDGDGDLDLAVGNGGVSNRVYDNTPAGLALAWPSAPTYNTLGIAWGDWNGDGDLDLAVGPSSNAPVEVYDNTGAAFTLGWGSGTGFPENFGRLAWGDADGDGDLDLAVRNHQYGPDVRTRIFFYSGGDFPTQWLAPSSCKAMDVAFADWDNDGDLDLAQAISASANQVFENSGGTFALAWTAGVAEYSSSLAWGDWDNDGDPDLAVGNRAPHLNRIYENGWLHRPSRLPESPVSPVLERRPGTTDAAFFYSAAEWVPSPVVVPYRLVDEESDPARRIRAEYSLTGGGSWHAATEGDCGDGTEELTAGPAGTAHEFCWDAEADGITRAENVTFRITVTHQASQRLAGPIQRAAMSATSPPFRLWLRQADLSLTNSDGSDTAVPGEAVVYTLTAANSGPHEVVGARVSDVFPAPLGGVTWTCGGGGGGGACHQGSGTGDIDTEVDLPAGGSVVLVATGTLAAGATGLLVNTATIAGPPAGGLTDPNAGNDVATDTDILAPESDLAITLTDGTETAAPGGSVTYVITATNAGPSDADGAWVVDTFPDEVAAVAWTCAGSLGGACAHASGSGDILEAVALPVGGSVAFQAVAQIDPAASGLLVDTAAVHSPAGAAALAADKGDPGPGDNTATDVDTLVPAADLVVGKSDGVQGVELGMVLQWTITVTNEGPSPVADAAVTDDFPAGVSGVTWTCSGTGGGSCDAASGSDDITTTVDLPAGGAAIFLANATVNEAGSQGLANTASAACPAGVTETDPSDNSATDVDLASPIFSSGFETGGPGDWSGSGPEP